MSNFDFEDTEFITTDYTTRLAELGVVPGATVTLSTGEQVEIDEVEWCNVMGTVVTSTEDGGGCNIGVAETYFLLGIEPE